MNINLNNYESFFLMYVDNELSASEKLCVEAFIQQYPYLQEEIDLLKTMILPADDTIVLDKTNLFRNEVIGLNLEEAMLLKLDNELPIDAEKELVKELDEDQDLQKSWQLLQKTKLNAAEIISFPHKSILYRTEGSRIVIGRFTKWAVAAALIAGGLFVGISLIKQQNTVEPEYAGKTTKPARKPDTKEGKTEKSGIAGKEEKASKNSESNDLLLKDEKNNNKAEYAIIKEKRLDKEPLKSGTNKESLIVQRDAVAKKDKLSSEEKTGNPDVLASNNEKLSIRNHVGNESGTMNALVSSSPRPEKEIIDRNVTPGENSYASLASFENQDKNDNHILFMDEEKVSRSKAGVFFKKLKRTVARSTNIKTGNSLKIAGFEFAVK